MVSHADITGNTNSISPGVLNAGEDAVRVASCPPHNTLERRSETRYLVSWKVAIAIKDQGGYVGKIKDISLRGASIMNVCSLARGASVRLHIYMPSLTRQGKPRILIVHGVVLHTVHDAKSLCFRIGIAFVKFEKASDCTYLEDRLSSYYSLSSLWGSSTN